jgi:MoxR-like ATPase
MSLMQQVAVDLATNTLAEGGLFSVNGPPGTGKTTLLMDLVAAVVLRRAEALCAFRRPAEAFEREKWDAGY